MSSTTMDQLGRLGAIATLAMADEAAAAQFQCRLTEIRGG